MVVGSSFSTGFPRNREIHLHESWPLVERALNEYGIDCEINLYERWMDVSTNRKKTRDPHIIVKASYLLKLLIQRVPAHEAIKILNDDMQCDIIKMGNLKQNKERFVKRRQYLMGPNLCTLKAIKFLTGCFISVQGNTVAAIGPFKGLKQVRRIVEDCIQNVMHPVKHIKILLVKRQFAKNHALTKKDRDRHLPIFKKNIVDSPDLQDGEVLFLFRELESRGYLPE